MGTMKKSKISLDSTSGEVFPLSRTAWQAMLVSMTQFCSVMFEKKDGSVTTRLIHSPSFSKWAGDGPLKGEDSPYRPFASLNDQGIRRLDPAAIVAISCGEVMWARNDALKIAKEIGLNPRSKIAKVIVKCSAAKIASDCYDFMTDPEGWLPIPEDDDPIPEVDHHQW